MPGSVETKWLTSLCSQARGTDRMKQRTSMGELTLDPPSFVAQLPSEHGGPFSRHRFVVDDVDFEETPFSKRGPRREGCGGVPSRPSIPTEDLTSKALELFWKRARHSHIFESDLAELGDEMDALFGLGAGTSLAFLTSEGLSPKAPKVLPFDVSSEEFSISEDDFRRILSSLQWLNQLDHRPTCSLIEVFPREPAGRDVRERYFLQTVIASGVHGPLHLATPHKRKPRSACQNGPATPAKTPASAVDRDGKVGTAGGPVRVAKMLQRPLGARKGASDWPRTELHHLLVLDHPNIVRLHEHFEGDEGGCLILDYYRGGSLEEYLLKKRASGKGKLNAGFAANVMRQLFAGAAHMHSQSIVHLDLCSSNVVFDRFPEADGNPHVAIIDFGLSQNIDASPDVLAARRVPAGAKAILAPELWHGKLSEKADCFALGCLLFEMLAEAPPFLPPRDYVPAVNYWHQKPKAPWPMLLRASSDAIDLLRALLAQDPMQRPKAKSCLHFAYLTSVRPNVASLIDAARSDPRGLAGLPNVLSRSWLHRSIALRLSKELGPAEETEVLSLFSALNFSGEGYVKVGDIVQALELLRIPTSTALAVGTSLSSTRANEQTTTKRKTATTTATATATVQHNSSEKRRQTETSADSNRFEHASPTASEERSQRRQLLADWSADAPPTAEDPSGAEPDRILGARPGEVGKAANRQGSTEVGKASSRHLSGNEGTSSSTCASSSSNNSSDTRLSGKVRWTEFRAACLRLGDPKYKGALKRLFVEADEDRDGLLGYKDLATLLLLADPDMALTVARDVVTEMCGRASEGARIDFATFCEHFSRDVPATAVDLTYVDSLPKASAPPPNSGSSRSRSAPSSSSSSKRQGQAEPPVVRGLGCHLGLGLGLLGGAGGARDEGSNSISNFPEGPRGHSKTDDHHPAAAGSGEGLSSALTPLAFGNLDALWDVVKTAGSWFGQAQQQLTDVPEQQGSLTSHFEMSLEEQLQELAAMGFSDRQHNERALIKHNGDIRKAVLCELLVQPPPRGPEPSPAAEARKNSNWWLQRMF
mmetsp:Transcript_51670/g.112286  ORF Transcript_51670/g.112286 Transcript_51670/m.112286 type:complete len:1048 (+) Transcript_51670:881-4024(+)